MRNDEYKLRDCASALYDGGWRAEDKEWLIQEYGTEYGLSEDEAERICEYLAEFEEVE